MKRPLREKILIFVLSAVTLGSFVYAGKISIGLSEAQGTSFPQKPNVLVISVCSLRRDLLKAYGRAGEPVMPALDKFFAGSTAVFDRAFNGIPWISMVAFMGPRFSQMAANGYSSGSSWFDLPYIRVPLQKTFQQGLVTSDSINNSEFEKDHKIFSDEIKRLLKLPRAGPFLLVAHIKYMHYPMIDRFNPETKWDRYLSDQEKSRVQDYLAHPEKYYSKLPLLLLLTVDTKYALAHPEIAKSVNKRDEASVKALGGLMTNPKILAEWKASEGYGADLDILKKVYAATAHDFDKILEPILDLYGDEELKKNTLILFSGDHGEAHMERDQLTHANSLFDEDLLIPVAVQFPGGKRFFEPQIRVQDQWHIDTVADLMQKVMEGEVQRDNLPAKLKEMNKDVFLLRDCRNSMRGVRFKNKYKYWQETATGRQILFDLEKDPGELHDISATEPEIASRMEALYWENLDKFTWIFPDRCMPW